MQHIEQAAEAHACSALGRWTAATVRRCDACYWHMGSCAPTLPSKADTCFTLKPQGGWEGEGGKMSTSQRLL